jgi:hypothetical protein
MKKKKTIIKGREKGIVIFTILNVPTLQIMNYILQNIDNIKYSALLHILKCSAEKH